MALEMETSHRIGVASDLLPSGAKHAKVIVMHEESSVVDILFLARAAQASFNPFEVTP
ncbi:MAG: hypothetical protein K2P57_09495 [Burkholderiales bacterium]|nr:hypothetical protein [Burkholderiales bacterium]